MSTQLNVESFIAVLKKSRLVEPERIQRLIRETSSSGSNPETTAQLADRLVADNTLTRWQADKLVQGKHRGYFLGKYKLLSLLGKGGMSSVYMAEHLLMRRRCAIKVLPAKRVDDSSYLERFHREAQAAASLDHPNIVRAYDVDHQDDGDRQIHFIVMEYVDGTSIQDLVPPKGLASFLDAAEYARQAALGLQHAHENGMIHRDIKPGNLLVDRNGVVRILDLGLARFFLVDEGEAALTLRHDEKVLGTADYLAPEQALDSHSVDARADLYSLGCTLYFMVTGQPPFTEGSLAQRLLAHQVKTPPAVDSLRPDLPLSLAVIIRKMMAKKPSDRFLTAAETEAALFHWVDLNADNEWRKLHSSVYGSRVLDSNAAETGAVSGGMSPSSESNVDALSERDSPFPVVWECGTSPLSDEIAEVKPTDSADTALTEFLSALGQSATSGSPADLPESPSNLENPAASLKKSSSSIPTVKPPPLPSAPDSVFQDLDPTPPASVSRPSKTDSTRKPTARKSTTLSTANLFKYKPSSLTLVGTLLVLALCGILISFFLNNHSANAMKNSRSTTKSPFAKDKRQIAVGGNAADYQSISEALMAVRDRYRPALGSVDRIVIKVSPGTYNERIHIDGRSGNWPEGIQLVGVGIVRLAPLGSEPVIRLANLSRFSIENFQIDAEDRKVAVELRDDLHECRLIQVTVGDFTDIGIDCIGAQGLSFGNSQLFLERLRFDPASSKAVGIRLTNGSENDVNNVVIRGCQFLESMDAGILFQGPSPYGVTISDVIFYEANDGIRIEGTPTLKSIRVFNNSFRDVNHGLRFLNQPTERSAELMLRRNLFTKTRGAEAVVEKGFDETKFRSMLTTNPVGVQSNWSDRHKPASPKLGELQLLFENGGRQGADDLSFVSTDPDQTKFLVPSEKSPQKDVPGAQGDEKKWVGAVSPD